MEVPGVFAGMIVIVLIGLIVERVCFEQIEIRTVRRWAVSYTHLDVYKRQHILLAMAAEKELGSPTALDENLVAMAHPDGAAALISKRGITAHFTTPPYLFEELSQPDFHLVTDDIEAFGQPFSFNVGVATEKFHNENPVAYACFVNAISEAMAWINTHKKAVSYTHLDVYKRQIQSSPV